MAQERMAVLRILDANANRAREGLRVVEDYCRFVLENEGLSGAIKQARHRITARVAEMASAELLDVRDSESDVGAHGSEPSHEENVAAEQIVTANMKRAQEAVRCLEEYAKTLDVGQAEGFKRIRFELYTLEKKVLPVSGID